MGRMTYAIRPILFCFPSVSVFSLCSDRDASHCALRSRT